MKLEKHFNKRTLFKWLRNIQISFSDTKKLINLYSFFIFSFGFAEFLSKSRLDRDCCGLCLPNTMILLLIP